MEHEREGQTVRSEKDVLRNAQNNPQLKSTSVLFAISTALEIRTFEDGNTRSYADSMTHMSFFFSPSA